MNKGWAIFLLLAGGAGFLGAEPLQIDGVAAWVNGVPITVMDVLRDAQPQFAALMRDRTLSRADITAKRIVIFNQVRRGLIDAELIYAWFGKEKAGAQSGITDQMVDARIDEIVQDEFGGSREKLMKALADDRLTYDDWRGRMNKRIIVQGMRQREIMAKIQITPQVIRAYYDSHKSNYEHPGQVLLRRIVLTGDDAEARSQGIVDRLSEGEDFAAIAKSPAGGSDPAGGLWGWKDLTDLSEALREKLAIMRLGGVCRLNLGGDWHLVKLESRESVPFETAAPEIEDFLRRQEADRLTGLWMERLQRDFHVKIIDQPIWED